VSFHAVKEVRWLESSRSLRVTMPLIIRGGRSEPLLSRKGGFGVSLGARPGVRKAGLDPGWLLRWVAGLLVQSGLPDFAVRVPAGP
jgi:hypothetical protein